MSLLPTTREQTSSHASVANTESSASTRIAPDGGTKPPSVNSNEKSGDYDEKGFEDKGLIEVDDEGRKRTMRVVLEQKSGRELLKEVSGGKYTIPRW
jgi:hypothetical protein